MQKIKNCQSCLGCECRVVLVSVESLATDSTAFSSLETQETDRTAKAEENKITVHTSTLRSEIWVCYQAAVTLLVCLKYDRAHVLQIKHQYSQAYFKCLCTKSKRNQAK